jgi:predicted unusual protein kinase regulating ubiquinone biosynthesis (AarF/ABC1/UbiB family)
MDDSPSDLARRPDRRAPAADERRARRRESRVPQGRGERIARLGGMLAGIAGETALEALRRLGGGGEDGSVVLTRANAQRVTDTLSNLRGAAMKLGQMLSLHGDDLLPPEFVQILSAVRNQAHFMPEEQVRAVLVRELGPGWESRFAEFDFEPLAAASIGQVHAARGLDGAELALKVQYPGVDRSIGSDVDNLAVLLRVTRILPAELELDPLLDEVKRELQREADYRREADSTERYGELCRDDPGVLVPSVHRALSSRRVLATDRVFGLPIEDLRSPEHSQERRDRAGTRLLGLVLRELFEFRFMQTDPNFANYLFDPQQERIALLDFGAARRFTRRFTEAYRRLLVAAVEGDRPGLFEVSRELGFLRGDEDPETLDMYVRLLSLLSEPLRSDGPYDFPSSDLARRARETSLEAIARYRLPNPPSETLFLHRKLGGSFLLAAHIGAVVDTRALYRRYVLRED